jgi:hypothetical protein
MKPVSNGQQPTSAEPANGAGPQPKVAVTKVAWMAPPDLDLKAWIEQGRRIGVMGRSAGWWIGDWLRFGNAKYGERYARAVRITGYDSQTLMNMVYVASRFDISRRREKLSWSHHAELAALEPGPQDELLERAEHERLSVRDLREMMRAHRRDEPDDEEEIVDAAADVVVCPACGHEFEKR